MGLDYSYRLFFRRQSLRDVLQGVAAFSRPGVGQVSIRFPDRVMELPFKAMTGTGEQIAYDDPKPEWDLATSLYFDVDDDILAYLDEYRDAIAQQDRGQGECPSRSQEARVAIGYIHLTVYRDLSALGERYSNPDVIMLRFSAATSSMSLLFADSQSIRNGFTRLLSAHGGICGLLDREYDVAAIWWRGETTFREIPFFNWLSFSKIEHYLQTGELSL
jgi:hypothetical protein